MAKKATKKQTPEEQALALTSDGIFRQFESVVPEGATTVHVLEAAATLIAASLVQMDATRQDLHNVMVHLEEYAAKKVELRKADKKPDTHQIEPPSFEESQGEVNGNWLTTN